MKNYQLLEMEVSYVRPQEIERKLELARFSREGRMSRTGLGERVLLALSNLLISPGERLKARLAPLDAGTAAS